MCAYFLLEEKKKRQIKHVKKRSRKWAEAILACANQYETETCEGKMYYLGNKESIIWKHGKTK